MGPSSPHLEKNHIAKCKAFRFALDKPTSASSGVCHYLRNGTLHVLRNYLPPAFVIGFSWPALESQPSPSPALGSGESNVHFEAIVKTLLTKPGFRACIYSKQTQKLRFTMEWLDSNPWFGLAHQWLGPWKESSIMGGKSNIMMG